MKNIGALSTMLAIYFIVMFTGLYVGSTYVYVMKTTPEELPPAVSNPESVKSSAQIFLYVIIATVVLLLMFKFGLDFIIKIMVIPIFFIGLLLTFITLFGLWGIILAIALIAATRLRKSMILFNLTLAFTIAGFGGYLGASLAVLPSLILLLLLSAYDIVAVYGTKHMVTLAEKAKGKIPFMFLIPIGDRALGLGTGDLAIPLMFAVSVLRDYGLKHSLFTVAGGVLGILWLFSYVTSRKKVTLPALPPMCAGLLIGFGIGLVSGQII